MKETGFRVAVEASMDTYALCDDLKLNMATARTVGSFEEVAAAFREICIRLDDVNRVAQLGILLVVVPVGTSVGDRVDVTWQASQR